VGCVNAVTRSPGCVFGGELRRAGAWVCGKRGCGSGGRDGGERSASECGRGASLASLSRGDQGSGPGRRRARVGANVVRRGVRWRACGPKISEQHFFWSGESKRDSATGDWQRALMGVFKEAKIPDGHAHRFRDTFAVGSRASGEHSNQVRDLEKGITRVAPSLKGRMSGLPSSGPIESRAA